MFAKLAKQQNRLKLGVVLIISLFAFAGCVPRAAPIIVQWSTETEVNTAGFNVFRSEARTGTYEKINDTLIPSALDPLLGGRYAFTDTKVVVGKTYFYKLQEVELNGATQFIEGNVVEATAMAQGFLGVNDEIWLGIVAVLILIFAGVTLAGRRKSRLLQGENSDAV